MYNERLTELKNAKGLTNQQISDISGVPLSTVTRIMNGSGEGSFQTVCDIIKALDTSIDELVGIKKENEKEKILPPPDPLIELYQKVIIQKDKWIKVLFFILTLIMLVCVGVVVYDIMNGSIGYVRY